LATYLNFRSIILIYRLKSLITIVYLEIFLLLVANILNQPVHFGVRVY